MCKIAYEQGYARLSWQCLDWNTPSLEFYDNMGALRLNEWVNLRMGREEMHVYLEKKEKPVPAVQ